ncbi:hypothetical protein HBI57_025520 [Parastagonospora nodorum]|nr:hypothetical protein HBH72_041380 [Parastagonospora nodorum]KAH6466952.1 hypothetical protein HBI57_025520 [Parastagonospora nodorum]KAH6497793.1 hypothetical protein HBI58_039710 [Parastagonospora nodorum]
MKQEDHNEPRLNGVDALIELEAATKNVAAALQKSVTEYNELMEKYTALQEMVKNGATNVQANSEPGSHQRYVVVMIDAYENELTDLFLRYAEMSIATQKYTLEDALKDWFKTYHPELAHLHRIVQIYADYGFLFAGSAQSGHGEDGVKQRPLAQLLSTSSAYFNFINVISEKDVIRKMQGLTIRHIAEPDCIGFWFSTDCCSHLSAPDEYSGKMKNISAEFATILSDLVEGKLPSLNPAYSRGEVTQVREVTSIQDVVSDNKSAQRKDSYGYFENNRYVARTPPKSDMESFKIPQNMSSPSKPSAMMPPKPRAGLVPLNTAGHRLDHPVRPPTSAEQTALKNRTKKGKLCSPFYLTGTCPVKSCRFDHTPISQNILVALKYKLIKWPCRFGCACRRKDCFNGHLCSTKGCNGPGGFCKFGKDSHGVDMIVAQWVEPVCEWGKPAEGYRSKNSEDQSSKSSMEIWPTMGNLIDI